MANTSNTTQKNKTAAYIAAVNIGQDIKKGEPVIPGNKKGQIKEKDMQKFIDAGHVIPAPEAN